MSNSSPQRESRWAGRQATSVDSTQLHDTPIARASQHGHSPRGSVMPSQLREELASLWNKAVMRSEEEFKQVETKHVIWQERLSVTVESSMADIKHRLHIMQQQLQSVTRVEGVSQLPRPGDTTKTAMSTLLAKTVRRSPRLPEPEASNIQSVKATASTLHDTSSRAASVAHQASVDVDDVMKRVESGLDKRMEELQERLDENYHMHRAHVLRMDELLSIALKQGQTAERLEEFCVRLSKQEDTRATGGTGDPLMAFDRYRSPKADNLRPINREPHSTYQGDRVNTLAVPGTNSNGRESQSAAKRLASHDKSAVSVLHTFNLSQDLPPSVWSQDKDVKKQTFLHYIQLASFVLIVFNTIFLGIEMDITIRRALQGNTEPLAYLALGHHLFTGAFVSEIVLRLSIERYAFFWGPNTFWNMFDSSIVLLHFLEAAFNGLGHASLVRIARLAKLVRTARMIRTIKHLRIVRLICDPEVWRPLFMVFASLFISLYLFAIAVTAGVVSTIEAGGPEGVPDRLVDLYGSVPRTMVTLFKAISGGEPWNELSKPLTGVAAWLQGALLVYLFFMIFGLMNTMGAMYIDSFIHQSNMDRMMTDRKASDRSRLSSLRDVLLCQPLRGESRISHHHMVEALNGDGAKYLKKLGLDVGIAEAIFKVLDSDSDDAVEVDELIYSLSQLKGNPQGVYLTTLQHQSKKLILKVNHLSSLVEEQLPLLAALGGSQVALAKPGPVGRQTR